MSRRMPVEVVALMCFTAVTGGGCATIAVCGGLGLFESEAELDRFEVVTPEDGDAFDDTITFTFDVAADPADTGVTADIFVDGVGVATGDATMPLEWTPAHDSGELIVDINGYIPALTGEIRYHRLILEWSAPWQASLLECAGLACAAAPDDLVIASSVRLWARPDFDLARTSRVEYRVDGAVIATRTEPPFWLDVDGSIAAPGAHTLETTVRRDDGEETTTSTPIVTGAVP